MVKEGMIKVKSVGLKGDMEVVEKVMEMGVEVFGGGEVFVVKVERVGVVKRGMVI